MTKKTYGVSGYIEWVAGIHTGSARLQVPFTGGAITKYGVVPAEFTTSDPLIQYLIENSGQYGEDKRIRLIREEPVPEEKSTGTGGKTGMETIHVSNLTEAAQILRDRFGVSSARVLSKEEAKRIGLGYKVKFIGI